MSSENGSTAIAGRKEVSSSSTADGSIAAVLPMISRILSSKQPILKRTADRLFGDDYRWSVLGAGGAQLLHFGLPALPVSTPIEFAVLALVIAVTIGILAGIIPAQRAARMDPVEALRAE